MCEVNGSNHRGFTYRPRVGDEPFAVPTVQLKGRWFVDGCRPLRVQVQVQLVSGRRTGRHEGRPDGRLDWTVQVAGHQKSDLRVSLDGGPQAVGICNSALVHERQAGFKRWKVGEHDSGSIIG